MKSIALAMALVAAAPVGEAAETTQPQPLLLRPKAALATSTPRHYDAPFVFPSDDADLELIPRRDERLEESRSSCAGERSLCYDPHSRRIVYKPARAFMPDIPGMTPENISVRRDRIVFRYSFQ